MRGRYGANILVSGVLFLVCLFQKSAAQGTNDIWMPEMVSNPKIVLEVQHTGPELLKVDEIEVNLLGGINEHPSGQALIDGYNVLKTKMIRGQDARDIAEMWRILPRSPLVMMMCHNPVYGLRFRLRGKVILETTVCWHCNTYDWISSDTSIAKGGLLEWGFDGESKYAQMLLKSLEKQVPRPAEKKHPADAK